MKKRVLLAWMLLCALLCGLLPALAEDAPSLTANKEQLVIAVGKTASFKLTLAPASLRKGGVTYASSDETVATVDRNGKVKGVAEGQCEVVVTCKKDESVQLVLPVQVVVPVKKLTAHLESAPLHIGATTQVLCDFSPENATLQQVVYSSSKESVATVDENGVVTGVGKGKAYINVVSADGQAKARIVVKVMQQPTDVSLNLDSVTLATGKTATLKAKVLPASADDKKVLWSSSDTSIATVDKNGRVKALNAGDAVITAACDDDPSITASAEIHCVQLAQSVSFEQKDYSVLIGGTLTVEPIVLPENTSDKSVTWKSSSPKVASVDENGVITANHGGKATITAFSADGSKRRGYFTVHVIVPVTGAHFQHEGMRVGAGSYTYVTAVMEPEDATNRNMTWTSSDPSIATVKGTTNKARVSGRKWGRCQLTGVTEDGGYTATINVNVGALGRAVTVESIENKDGEPYIVLKNRSNMLITSVTYQIQATDNEGNFIQLSTKGTTLTGTYGQIEPGAKTRHGHFHFIHYRRPSNLSTVSIAITGWECADGYYDNDGQLLYSYTVPKSKLEWVDSDD